MAFKYKMGFVGGGNMAQAIIKGIINKNIAPTSQIVVSTASKQGDIFGAKIINDNDYICNNCEYVFLAVKPQVFKSIFANNNNYKCKYVVSVMAGITIQTIEKAFKESQIVRTMPNTPCSIGQGMTAITNNKVDSQAQEFIQCIFNSVGKSIIVDENFFDAVTSISGSGPAYVYYFMDSMIKAGCDGGLSYEVAKELVSQTIIGAQGLASESYDLNGLIEKVCSKGGTTIQAIQHFKNNHLDTIVKDGIELCRKRSEELSKV